MAVSSEGKIYRLDLSGRAIVNPVETYQGGIYNASFNANNKSVFMAGAGGAVQLWDLQGRQIADFPGHWGLVRSVNLSQDGK